MAAGKFDGDKAGAYIPPLASDDIAMPATIDIEIFALAEEPPVEPVSVAANFDIAA